MKQIASALAAALIGSACIASTATAATTSSAVAASASWLWASYDTTLSFSAPEMVGPSGTQGRITYVHEGGRDPCGNVTTLRLTDFPVTATGSPGSITFAGSGWLTWTCSDGLRRYDYDVQGTLVAHQPGSGGLDYGLSPIGASVAQRFHGVSTSSMEFQWRYPGYGPTEWNEDFALDNTGTLIEYAASASL